MGRILHDRRVIRSPGHGREPRPPAHARGAHGASDERSDDRVLEVLAILLLALAAVGTAWSGYQAARWSGEETHDFAESDAAHARSTRADPRRPGPPPGPERLRALARPGDPRRRPAAGSRSNTSGGSPAGLRRVDRARTARQPRGATHPVADGRVPATGGRARRRPRARADELFVHGNKARDNADDYVLTTVFFALVLFFAGISLRLRSRRAGGRAGDRDRRPRVRRRPADRAADPLELIRKPLPAHGRGRASWWR